MSNLLQDIKIQIHGSLFFEKLKELGWQYEVEFTRLLTTTNLSAYEYEFRLQEFKKKSAKFLKLMKTIENLLNLYSIETVQKKIGRALQKIRRRRKNNDRT
jgi:dephospho-CoA kinase